MDIRGDADHGEEIGPVIGGDGAARDELDGWVDRNDLADGSWSGQCRRTISRFTIATFALSAASVSAKARPLRIGTASARK